jgi:Rps23 Pro-64 3,4-dihydroxylase Tpa1-like proline 4-hydroxylase
MSHINEKLFEPATIEELKKQFNEFPLRRVVIDNFLKPEIAESIFEHFPDETQMRRHYKGLNEQKSEGSSFDQYHPHFEEVRQSIMAQNWAKVLDKITGFTGLVLPDDFRGAGVHQGFDGSFLDIHVDFNIHPVLDLHRRLNLLIYMNKDWKKEYGGYLELWNEDVSECIAEIEPSFNRCVIFETNEVSYHGYDKMNLPKGVTRKSIFSYYYTPIEARNKVKYHDTIFKARPSDTNMKKTKTVLKEIAKNTIKKGIHALGLKKFFKKFE